MSKDKTTKTLIQRRSEASGADSQMMTHRKLRNLYLYLATNCPQTYIRQITFDLSKVISAHAANLSASSAVLV